MDSAIPVKEELKARGVMLITVPIFGRCLLYAYAFVRSIRVPRESNVQLTAALFIQTYSRAHSETGNGLTCFLSLR